MLTVRRRTPGPPATALPATALPAADADADTDATDAGAASLAARWRAVLVWAAIEVAAVVLIAGRYDWSAPVRRYAERGWLLSSYLAVLALPFTHLALVRLTARRRVAAAVTAALFVVLTVPYRWVGLDRAFHDAGRSRPWYNPPDEVPWPRTAFLPGGPWSTFPGALRLFGVAALAVVAVVVLRCRGRARLVRGERRARLQARRTVRSANRRTMAAGALALAVVGQAFLHSGVRGPYVYMTHFQGPTRPDLWFAVAHYPDGSGVTIADQFVFSAMEQYFHGVAIDPNNMLVRRPLSFYAASQFSYFTNTYAVWIVLNMVLWGAAVAATAGFVRRATGDGRVALTAAAMVAFGPGFVAFAGTSGMYLAGFAAPAVALWLCERFLVAERDVGAVVLAAVGIGLCALTYDLTVYFPVLAAYALVRRTPWRAVLGALVGAYAVYRGFLFCHDVVLGIPVVDTNVVQLANARARVADVAADPTGWPAAIGEATGAFATMLWRMFFGVPVVLALAGLWRLRDRALQVLVGGMVLMTFATVAFLRIGDQLIGWMPRFTYPAYPAVYLLAALGLHGAVRPLADRRLRVAAVGSVLGLLAVLANIDAVGHPRLYFEALEGTRMGTYLVIGPDGEAEVRSQ